MAALPRAEAPLVRVVASSAHLPFRVRPANPLTAEELSEFCAANSDLRIEQSAGGELLIMPPAGSRTGARGSEITYQLQSWTRRNGTGVGFDSSAGFTLPNGAVRSPDASWIHGDRWDALSETQRRGFAPICPDFVVELRSPSDTLSALRAKLEEYIAQGAQLGWLIDPDHRRVHVYRPGAAPEVLDAPDEVAGDPVLPGFVLDLTPIW